jgi:hypothetical protein
MIGGPTVQHVEIGYASLDETNDLGIHDRASFDASSFLDNPRAIVEACSSPSQLIGADSILAGGWPVGGRGGAHTCQTMARASRPD